MTPRRIELRVAGVLTRNGKVLLVKHRKPWGTYWVVPGGHVEYGETLGKALEREFMEELAVRVKVDDLLWVNDAAPADGQRHVVNVYFRVSSDDKLDGTALGGVEGAAFFAREELEGLDIRPPLGDRLEELVGGAGTAGTYLGNLWP